MTRPSESPWPPLARRAPRWKRFLGFAAWGILLSSAVSAGFFLVRYHPRFAIQRVVLEGVPSVRQPEAEAVTDPWIGQPLLFVELEKGMQSFASSPWVETVTARRVLPDTVIVCIKARSPVALAIRKGELWTIDRSGNWLGPHGGRPGNQGDDYAIIDPGESADTANVARGAAFITRILEDDPGLFARISEVEILPDGIAVIDRVSRFRILFGRNALAANEAVSAWRALIALKPELDRHSLSRVDVDLRFSGRIVLTAPAEDSVRGKT